MGKKGVDLFGTFDTVDNWFSDGLFKGTRNIPVARFGNQVVGIFAKERLKGVPLSFYRGSKRWRRYFRQ